MTWSSRGQRRSRPSSTRKAGTDTAADRAERRFFRRAASSWFEVSAAPEDKLQQAEEQERRQDQNGIILHMVVEPPGDQLRFRREQESTRKNR